MFNHNTWSWIYSQCWVVTEIVKNIKFSNYNSCLHRTLRVSTSSAFISYCTLRHENSCDCCHLSCCVNEWLTFLYYTLLMDASHRLEKIQNLLLSSVKKNLSWNENNRFKAAIAAVLYEKIHAHSHANIIHYIVCIMNPPLGPIARRM